MEIITMARDNKYVNTLVKKDNEQKWKRIGQ